MIELRDGVGFPFEPIAEFSVSGERCRQDLDRDEAIEPRVARLVDLAHTALAEERHDFVGAEAGAGSEGHVVGFGGLYEGFHCDEHLYRGHMPSQTNAGIKIGHRSRHNRLRCLWNDDVDPA
jgi:hypothetical protein